MGLTRRQFGKVVAGSLLAPLAAGAAATPSLKTGRPVIDTGGYAFLLIRFRGLQSQGEAVGYLETETRDVWIEKRQRFLKIENSPEGFDAVVIEVMGYNANGPVEFMTMFVQLPGGQWQEVGKAG